MNIKQILIIIIVLCTLALIILYPFKENITNKYYCKVDSDCISETCCHANSCINKNFEPDCTDIICTTECAPNTMDCNQGSCQCINHKCKAVINPNNSLEEA